MEGAFRLNMGIALCLNRKLPYGDKSSEMDFFEAAVKGNLDRLREMAKGKDAVGMARLANVCVGGAVGPLQAAVRLGRLDVVRCLVEELGFDINGGSKDCDITALASAALDEKLDTVRYLLDNGADPNKKDDPGSVPLHCAAKNGHDEVARFLLSRGASVDIAYFHGTPLHIAAAYGKPNVMKVLLEHHADPDRVSEELGTPLVAALNATGADVNSTGPDTPLVVATALDLTGCIKYLLKAGGDPNITTDSDLLPIQIAACHGNRKVVEILFPFTAPIPIVSNWSVEGILAHVKAIHSKGKGKQCGKHTKAELNNCTKAELKSDGDKAVGRKDYLAASKFYTEAIGLDPNDATLYSNRSLCHVKMGEATKALFDANTCIMMQPEWLKGYYRKGAALMSLKEYKGACDAFLAGMKLDPNNADMETMFRKALEAMKKEHGGR